MEKKGIYWYIHNRFIPLLCNPIGLLCTYTCTFELLIDCNIVYRNKMVHLEHVEEFIEKTIRILLQEA